MVFKSDNSSIYYMSTDSISCRISNLDLWSLGLFRSLAATHWAEFYNEYNIFCTIEYSYLFWNVKDLEKRQWDVLVTENESANGHSALNPRYRISQINDTRATRLCYTRMENSCSYPFTRSSCYVERALLGRNAFFVANIARK